MALLLLLMVLQGVSAPEVVRKAEDVGEEQLVLHDHIGELIQRQQVSHSLENI